MRLPFKAWYFRSTIDENLVREKLPEYTVEFIDPLVIKIDEDHRVMITSFGAIVFFSFDEEIAKLIANRILETIKDPYFVKEVEDRLIVDTGTEDRFLHNEIRIKENDELPSRLRIIAMLLAQSVALDHLERETDIVLQGFTQYLDDLKERGRIWMSARKILKTIGFAMQVRFSVLSNLALFDKPAETWDSESLEDLYQEMKDFFDIAERQEVLSTKLDFISENTRMLFEVLSSRKSHSLEWIVIILILIEIVGLGVAELISAIAGK
ncbi:MAG TPA: RMD1 family protein [Chitinispirillaceae bacterium]|nr:RMD1 family protein [Chitinispirillaceae bacterium]